MGFWGFGVLGFWGAEEFLRTVAFPARVHVRDFQANAVAKLRVERARMLAAAGLDDWAETELRTPRRMKTSPT